MPRKSKRNDVVVKVDSEVIRMARIVASYEDIPLAELVSRELAPIMEKLLTKHGASKPAPLKPSKPKPRD